MATIREFTIDGDRVMFVNQWRSTRNGFAHDAEFFYNGFSLVKTSCHYINRTWENYTFQSVMLKAIGIAMDEYTERQKRDFKAENGYRKMTAQRKEEFEKMLAKSGEYNKFIRIRDNIRGKVY